jgi:hypothetical protein
MIYFVIQSEADVLIGVVEGSLLEKAKRFLHFVPH